MMYLATGEVFWGPWTDVDSKLRVSSISSPNIVQFQAKIFFLILQCSVSFEPKKFFFQDFITTKKVDYICDVFTQALVFYK